MFLITYYYYYYRIIEIIVLKKLLLRLWKIELFTKFLKLILNINILLY